MRTKPLYANNRGSCLNAAPVAAAATLLDVGAGDGGEVDVGDRCSAGKAGGAAAAAHVCPPAPPPLLSVLVLLY